MSSVGNLTHLVTILTRILYLLQYFPPIYDTTDLHKFLIVPNFTLSKYCFIPTVTFPGVPSISLQIFENLFLQTCSHKFKQPVQARSQKAGQTQSLQYTCKFFHNFTTFRTLQLPMDFGTSLLTRMFIHSLVDGSINVFLLISCLTLAND